MTDTPQGIICSDNDLFSAGFDVLLKITLCVKYCHVKPMGYGYICLTHDQLLLWPIVLNKDDQTDKG